MRHSETACLFGRCRLSSKKTDNASESCMTDPAILAFGEPTDAATAEDGLAFVERTRRQLDRYERMSGVPYPAEHAECIRRMCDTLEADIRRSIAD
jgi:hypothetical protein